MASTTKTAFTAENVPSCRTLRLYHRSVVLVQIYSLAFQMAAVTIGQYLQARPASSNREQRKHGVTKAVLALHWLVRENKLTAIPFPSPAGRYFLTRFQPDMLPFPIILDLRFISTSFSLYFRLATRSSNIKRLVRQRS